MKVYQISYNDSYTHRVYIIASETEGEALHMAAMAETATDLRGIIHHPSLFDFSEPKQLKGLTTKTPGIKSIIIPEDLHR